MLYILIYCLTISAAPSIFIEKIDEIPDYYQRDREFGGFPRGGSVYCGPTTVSNSLIWFARNGYTGIIELTENVKKDQHELIRQLGSPQYINTGKGGSSPDMILTGVQKFLNERNYNSAKLKFYGWRPVPQEFKAHSTIPDLQLAKDALLKNDAVWLNIGWYDYNEKKKEYKRTGGHWVTFVGYGHNGKKNDSDVLIIHDPETHWHDNDYIKIQKLTEGTLAGDMTNLPQNASGYHSFSVGFRQYGVIEGMIVLEMPEKKHETVSMPN